MWVIYHAGLMNHKIPHVVVDGSSFSWWSSENMDILGLMGLTGNDIASLGASNFDLNNEMYKNGLICHYSLRSSWWFAKYACLEMEFLLYYKLYSTNVHLLAWKLVIVILFFLMSTSQDGRLFNYWNCSCWQEKCSQH